MLMTGMAMMMTIMMAKSYDRKINSIPGRVWEELHQTGFLHFEECVLFIREPVRCWIHPFPSSIIRIRTKLFLMWKSQIFCNNQFLKPCNALNAKSCAKFISWLWKQFFLMLIWDQYSSLIATLGQPASISKLQINNDHVQNLEHAPTSMLLPKFCFQILAIID